MNLRQARQVLVKYAMVPKNKVADHKHGERIHKAIVKVARFEDAKAAVKEQIAMRHFARDGMEQYSVQNPPGVKVDVRYKPVKKKNRLKQAGSGVSKQSAQQQKGRICEKKNP